MRGSMGYNMFVKTLENYRTISGIEVTRHECYKAHLTPCNDLNEQLEVPIRGCSFQDLAIKIMTYWTELKYSETPLPDTWGVFINKIFVPGEEISEWAKVGRRKKDTHRPYSCTCSCKVMVVPSRPLTPLEWALVDDTPWGAAVFQFIAAYLGMQITSPYARNKVDCSQARKAQNAERAFL
eukprot:5128943-Heterocapsa_arctica.AAC.1